MTLDLVYVGHATVLVELDGVRVLTDPLLRRRVTFLRRIVPAPAVPADVDAVLVSHAHFDHLDLRSLALLGRDTRVVVPRGLGRLLRARGFAAAIELDEGESVELEGIRLRTVTADHDGRRLPWSRPAATVGYLVEGSQRVYFAGDTDLFDGMEGLADGLDVALIPVSGWGPTIGAGHLDPERAAEATRRLRPRVAVPIHWGTYAMPGRPVGRPRAPEEFAELVGRLAGAVRVEIVAPGERIRIAPAT